MRPRSSTYSPRQLAPEDLQALYVSSWMPKVTRLASSFIDAATSGCTRNTLILGPRGAGKSHLIGLVSAALERDPEFTDRAILVALGEEEHVASLTAFLARILCRLISDPKAGSPLRGLPPQDAEGRAVILIEQALQGRQLLLAIENLDQVFHAIEKPGRTRFRAILQNQRTWSVLASAIRHTPAFTHADEPFYLSFAPLKLKPFTTEECREALARLAQVRGDRELYAALMSPRGMARVSAIRHLTGGSPRAMALIFPYLTADSLDELITAFHQLSEDLTVYFQEVMTRLPPAQRAVMEILSENWRPMTVKAIAEETYQANTTVSSLLRRLLHDNLVSRTQVGRESFYVVAEPLHRIARAMKRDDRGMEVLARFLRHWHERKELEAFRAPVGFDQQVTELALCGRWEESGYDSTCDDEITTLTAAGKHEAAIDVARRWVDDQGGQRAEFALLVALSEGSHPDFSAQADACFARWPADTGAQLLARGDPERDSNLHQRCVRALSEEATPMWRKLAAALALMEIASTGAEPAVDAALDSYLSVRDHHRAVAGLPEWLRQNGWVNQARRLWRSLAESSEISDLDVRSAVTVLHAAGETLESALMLLEGLPETIEASTLLEAQLSTATAFGAWKKVLQMGERVSKAGTSSSNVHKYVAFANYKLNDNEACLSSLNEVAVPDRDARHQLHIALALMRLGRVDAAHEAFELAYAHGESEAATFCYPYWTIERQTEFLESEAPSFLAEAFHRIDVWRSGKVPPPLTFMGNWGPTLLTVVARHLRNRPDLGLSLLEWAPIGSSFYNECVNLLPSVVAHGGSTTLEALQSVYPAGSLPMVDSIRAIIDDPRHFAALAPTEQDAVRLILVKQRRTDILKLLPRAEK